MSNPSRQNEPMNPYYRRPCRPADNDIFDTALDLWLSTMVVMAAVSVGGGLLAGLAMAALSR